jgi:hypothetical protein
MSRAVAEKRSRAEQEASESDIDSELGLMEEAEEFPEFMEGGAEMQEVAADDDDASSASSHVQVEFSVDGMLPEDAPRLVTLMEMYTPDASRLLDCRTIADAVAIHGVATSLVFADNGDEDKDSDSDSDDSAVGAAGPIETNDIYGVMSVVPLNFPAPKNAAAESAEASAAQGATELLKLLDAAKSAPGVTSAATATPVAPLLRSGKAVLMVNERFRNLPNVLVGRLWRCLLDEVAALPTNECKAKLGAERNDNLLLTVLAKVQQTGIANSAAVGQHKKGQKPEQKRRVDTTADTTGAEGEPYVFHRWEDELLFAARSKQVAVSLLQFPPAYDEQPEAEIPRCLAFAVRWGDLRAAVARIEKKSQEPAE